MQNNIEFILSPYILKGIPFDKYEQNFTFIVNNKEFHTSRFLADLISPIIRQYHIIDNTIDTFKLDFKEENSKLSFSDFLKIVSFEKIEISQEQLQYYIQILFLLGNREIIYRFVPSMNEDITVNNVFDRILFKENYYKQLFSVKPKRGRNNEQCIITDLLYEALLEEIDFISSHFSEIDQEKLKNLPIPIIESILSNPQLLLENEDSLFEFVTSLYLKNPTFSYLYEYVDFLLISADKMNYFFEIFDLTDINQSIWSEIIKRTTSTQKIISKHNYKKQEEKEEPKIIQQSNHDDENVRQQQTQIRNRNQPIPRIDISSLRRGQM